MLIFNNLEEMEPYYIEETNTYVFKEDIIISFPLSIDANIDALNIDAKDIDAQDIDALNIDALNIDAGDIKARNIDAYNIDAGDIKARNIDALDMLVGNINVLDMLVGNINACAINAWNIKYRTRCIAYRSFKCKSVKGKRTKSVHKCVHQEIEFIKD